MAISLPGSQTSYDFQNPQQCAIHLRLTPELKEALLQAQQQGGEASLQLTGHAADNALHIGGQSFALSAPIAQERFDVFKLSQHGCVQVGHIQQKSVVKRSGLQPANKQHGQPVTNQNHSDYAVKHSKGSLKNGVALPQIQAVKPPVQQQRPRTDCSSSTAHMAHASVPAARQHKTHTSHTVSAAPTAKPVWPHTGQHSSQEPSVHVQQHKQSLPNGTHTLTDSRHPSADPKQPQQSSQNAPPGSSLQSAQTALPQKPSKGKSAKAPAPAAASMLSEEVVQQVCAAARIGQKETVLIALLQCKPCKNQVLEAVLKEAEKRVPGFQRLQGESLKRACRSYGEMKPGNKWALQAQYVQQAHSILDRIQNLSPAGVATQMQHPSGPDKARKSTEPQPGVKRKRSIEPQPPSGAPEGYPSTDDGSDKAKKWKAVEPELLNGTGPQQGVTDGVPGVTKKKKRLRKAGDMERESQSEESDRAANIGLKQSLQLVADALLRVSQSSLNNYTRQRRAHPQVAGLDDSDSEDGAIPISHGPGRHVTQDHTHVSAAAAARQPPPGPHQRSTGPVDSQQWQAGLHRAPTADAQIRQTAQRKALQRDGTLHGHDRNATDYMHTQAEPLHGPFDHDRRGTGHAAGPSRHSSAVEHAGFAKSGNLTGDLTGLNAQMEDHEAGPSGSALDESAPAVGKIKLKIRRPVSAASEAYDESWFAEHLDQQPELQAPIQDLAEWEQCLHTYESKRSTYFRLHQEMLDLKIKVTGLQQAIQEAPDDAEKASLQQQFQSYWDKRLHRSQRWDKAFAVLHLELQALFSSLQSFYDVHAHSDGG